MKIFPKLCISWCYIPLSTEYAIFFCWKYFHWNYIFIIICCIFFLKPDIKKPTFIIFPYSKIIKLHFILSDHIKYKIFSFSNLIFLFFYFNIFFCILKNKHRNIFIYSGDFFSLYLFHYHFHLHILLLYYQDDFWNFHRLRKKPVQSSRLLFLCKSFHWYSGNNKHQ